MKKIFLIIMGLLVMVTACVDDYTDANPPTKLDAPFLTISETSANQVLSTLPVNQYQKTYEAYVTYDAVSEFTVNVIDAPGKVSHVSVTNSVPDFGSVTLNEASVNALIGQTSGEFKFSFAANPDLPDQADRAVNLVITVTDSQLDEDGADEPKSTQITLPTSIVTCISEGIEEGTYTVTAASGVLDGNVPYTLDDIEADNGGEYEVVITQTSPGRYVIDETTAGVWPLYYSSRARPVISFDLCGTEIAGHVDTDGDNADTDDTEVGGLRLFTLSGTDNGNGTIDFTWSYERIGGGTPANPANGTFTLTKK